MDSFETVRKNLPLWKRQRYLICSSLINHEYHDYDIFALPTNAIRSHQKKKITQIKPEDQEKVLFEQFMHVCQRGMNTAYIQCGTTADEDGRERILWIWCDETYRRQNSNIERWMNTCFDFGTSLFSLQMILTSLRNDKTRGPTVYIFCSLVIRHLRKTVYKQLDELDQLNGKNLLTLQRYCANLNIRIVEPLRKMAKNILEDDIVGGELINYLFEKKDHVENYHIFALVEEIISLSIERYYQVIFEWITQCTLTFDLAHEFYIWDLRKQNVVERRDFERKNELDWSEFDDRFVFIPQLIPEVFQAVSDKIYKLGKYLYTMKQQKASLEFLSSQYLLDQSIFKNRSLGQVCLVIADVHQKCTMNILEHFKQTYDIVNFAKELPCFFVGLNSTWIYEYIVLFEEAELYKEDLEKLPDKMNTLMWNFFMDNSELHLYPYHSYFKLTVSPFLDDKRDNFIPQPGTFPFIELNLVSQHSPLKLAFPARVLEPYRKIFYHLFLLNRAKYLMHRKYFTRNDIVTTDELTTIFNFIRFLNVYIEYISGIAANEHPEFARKLDLTHGLDELINVQLDFVNKLMNQAKLDQDYLSLKEQIVELVNEFSAYATDDIDYVELNKRGRPIVGRIKKFLLEHSRNLIQLKHLLFGSHFSAVGASADDEPLWKLLQRVDNVSIT